MVAVYLLACAAHDSEGTTRVRGAAAKGPLILGSTVELASVDATGEPTGEVFRTQTASDLGDFTLAAVTGTVDAEAQGYAFDELAGRLSYGTHTLRAVGDLTASSELYVNVVTHLAHDRVLVRMAGGEAVADAIDGAEQELRAALGVGPTGFDPGAEGTAMNLLGGDSDANAYLFAVSVVLLQAARAEADDEASVDATLQQMMNDLAADLADGGDLDADRRILLQAAEASIDSDAVTANLEAWLAERGSSAAVPDLGRVLDHDLDGMADNDDSDADGDGFEAGVDDCDDADPGLFPGADDACGDGIDADCDGLDPDCRWSDETDVSEADGTLLGRSGEGAGFSVAFAGDLDGDGTTDVTVGSQGGWDDAAKAWIAIGPPEGSASLSSAFATYQADATERYEVIPLPGGDLTGDGADDLVIAARYASVADPDEPEGHVSVLAGPLSGSLGPTDATSDVYGNPGDLLGSTSVVGELTGDGQDDLVVGSSTDSDPSDGYGAVYLFAGPLAGTLDLASATASVVPASRQDRVGEGLAAPADIDGDGTTDLVVSGSASVYVFAGPVAGALATDDAASTLECEYCLALTAEDADGDGYLDLLAATPADYTGGTYAGAAWLVLGPDLDGTAGDDAAATFLGSRGWEYLGRDATMADLDADGEADVVVGGPDDSPYSETGGGAYVFFGPLGGSHTSADADASFASANVGDASGGSLDVADVDGDGLLDLLVGGMGYDAGGSGGGAAWYFSGAGGS